MFGRNKRWFTFIEILIVITVFSIWVFAVVRLLTSNIVNVNSIKTKNSAVFLAKEWIDMVYNIKNSNIGKWLKWDCVLKDTVVDPNTEEFWNVDDVCKFFFSSWINSSKIFQIGFSTTGYFVVNQVDDLNFEKNFQASQLFYYTWTIAWKELSWYGYSWLDYSSSITKFARYIKIKPIIESEKELPIDKIVKIESHVLFKNWIRTGDVILESFISAY